MHPSMAPRFSILCSFLSGFLWLPSVSQAEPANASLSVQIDISEGHSAKAPLLFAHATLGIAKEQSCSTAKDTQGRVTYQFKVCRDGGDATAPLLSFEVQRNESAAPGVLSQEMHGSARLALHQRVLIGQLRRVDGLSLDVHATAN